MASIATYIILPNLIGLVFANVDPNLGSDFGSDFGILFNLPVENFNSTSSASGSISSTEGSKTQDSPGSKFDLNPNLNPSLDSSLSQGLNPGLSPSFSANLDLDYLNGQNDRNLNLGLSYPNVNYNANFAINPDPPDLDNCTINPCLNGFCLVNRSDPLGYECFCKGRLNLLDSHSFRIFSLISDLFFLIAFRWIHRLSVSDRV